MFEPRIPHILDAVVCMLSTIVASFAALATGSSPEDFELRLLLIPLVGSVIVCSGLVMLNPAPETRRIVIGRAAFALFLGVIGPQLLSSLHPTLAGLGRNPFALLFCGSVIAFGSYLLSKPFVRELYERAGDIAKEGAEATEQKIKQLITQALPSAPPQAVRTVTITETSPAPAPIVDNTPHP